MSNICLIILTFMYGLLAKKIISSIIKFYKDIRYCDKNKDRKYTASDYSSTFTDIVFLTFLIVITYFNF